MGAACRNEPPPCWGKVGFQGFVSKSHKKPRSLRCGLGAALRAVCVVFPWAPRAQHALVRNQALQTRW